MYDGRSKSLMFSGGKGNNYIVYPWITLIDTGSVRFGAVGNFSQLGRFLKCIGIHSRLRSNELLAA